LERKDAKHATDDKNDPPTTAEIHADDHTSPGRYEPGGGRTD